MPLLLNITTQNVKKWASRWPACKSGLLLLIFCAGCRTEIYKSNCDAAINFKQVTFAHLMDSVSYYNRQYVEVSGLYKSGAYQSALFADDVFTEHFAKNGLWVNFSQDCPLFLSGTTQGLFSSADGSFQSMNNRKIIIRGYIDINNKGYRKKYKACIDHVSLVEW